MQSGEDSQRGDGAFGIAGCPCHVDQINFFDALITNFLRSRLPACQHSCQICSCCGWRRKRRCRRISGASSGPDRCTRSWSTTSLAHAMCAPTHRAFDTPPPPLLQIYGHTGIKCAPSTCRKCASSTTSFYAQACRQPACKRLLATARHTWSTAYADGHPSNIDDDLQASLARA